METEKYFEQILQWEDFSAEQKIQILKDYIGDKAYKAIQKQAVRSKALSIPVSFSITDVWASDEDIWHFLKAIHAREYSVKTKQQSGTDMWWYSESRTTTKIEFTF